ncbi:hypothetical protein LCGC14_0378980 [marine sediment metagenome]|uniref:Uncharacterized protein n=1 Tax=marine sediment metagenome TaxID=412755 RepID=A0A0F9WBT5_9ZZZZ
MPNIFSGRGSSFQPFASPRQRLGAQSSFADFDLRTDNPSRSISRGLPPASIGLPPASRGLPPSRPFDESFRRGLFQDDPGLAFQTSVSQAGLDTNLTDFFRGKSARFLQQFQGALGSQIDEFGRSDLNPLDFFRDLDFESEFLRLSPNERGANDAGLNRASRFLF